MAGRGGNKSIRGLTFDTSTKPGEEPLESRPSALFPPHPDLKKPRPLTAKEKRINECDKELSDLRKSGMNYTHSTKKPGMAGKIFSDEQFNDQFVSHEKADLDPFNDGVETYSKTKAPKKRTVASVTRENYTIQRENIRFDKSHFPQELWSALEGKAGDAVKDTLIRGAQRGFAIQRMDGQANRSVSRNEGLAAALAELDDLEDEEEGSGDEEVVAEEDDEFDDEDIAGDYNAEQYFDGGDEDGEDGADE